VSLELSPEGWCLTVVRDSLLSLLCPVFIFIVGRVSAAPVSGLVFTRVMWRKSTDHLHLFHINIQYSPPAQSTHVSIPDWGYHFHSAVYALNKELNSVFTGSRRIPRNATGEIVVA
jgi:hypothetical protein